MAFQHSENPSLLGSRQSPGDAAFQRLQQREALRTKDKRALIDPALETSETHSAAVSPVEMPVAETGVAVALGIEATPDAPLRASPPRSARGQAPLRVAEATAEKLEATLLDQPKTPEETLQTPARMPPAEPLRLSQIVAEEPELVGLPRRSTFAPDPVRQRTYVDLRNPAPVPEKAASDDPPWRKYLAEPRRQGSRHAVSIHTEARRAEVRHHPALVAASYDTADDARERARGIGAMSAGALLGLGIGLGVLVLIRPSAEPVVSSMTAPQPAGAPRVIAAADVATQTAHSAATGSGIKPARRSKRSSTNRR